MDISITLKNLTYVVSSIPPNTFFWIIIAILFFILWQKSNKVSNELKERKEEIIEKSDSTKLSETGEHVFSSGSEKEAMEILIELISDISRISGYGFVISIVVAVLSSIYPLLT